MKSPAARARLLTFAMVGVAGFVVDAGVLHFAHGILGFEIHIARLLSFTGAALSTWALNRRFTFDAARLDSTLIAEWFRYFAGLCDKLDFWPGHIGHRAHFVTSRFWGVRSEAARESA